MKEFYKKYILDELPEDQKSEAQKETEASSKKYTDFFKKPLDKLRSKTEEEKAQGNTLKSISYRALATTYKTIAGLAINPQALESGKGKRSFWGQIKSEPSIGKKTLKILTLLPKIAAETIAETIQFTIRNTIKQPVMTVFRIGATINNTRKYLAAKLNGDKEQEKIEAANIKYQAKKTLKAAIATIAIAAIDFAIFASAGMATPSFGVATATVGHVAEAAHVSSLGKDTVEVATNEIRSRAPSEKLRITTIDTPDNEIVTQKTIDEVNIRKLEQQAKNIKLHQESEVIAHNLRDSLNSHETLHSVDSSDVRSSTAHLEKIKSDHQH